MISLKKLFKNSFPGHRGIPGHQGGSLPEGGGRVTGTEVGGVTPVAKWKLQGKGHKSAYAELDDVALRKKFRKAQMINDSDAMREMKMEMDKRRKARMKKTYGMPGLYRDIFKD